MTQPAAPLPILVAVLAAAGEHSEPTRSRIEGLYDALEAQGDRVAIRWFEGDRAAWRARPDIVPGEPLPVIYLEDPTGQEATAPWAGRARLVLYCGPQETPVSPDLCPLIRVHPALRGEPALEALNALWTALLAGHMLAQAVQAGNEAARRAWQDSALARWLAPQDPLDGAPALTLIAADSHQTLLAIRPEATKGIGKVVRFPQMGPIPPWQRLAEEPAPGGLPPEPEIELVGRAAELSTLDGLMQTSQAPSIALYGPTGVGKMALAAHLARWLVRRGRMERVVYTDFADGALPEVALWELRTILLGAPAVVADEAAAGQAPALAPDLAAELRRTPTLIIWDHCEAVLPEGASPWPAGQGALCRDLVEQIAAASGGRSRLLSIWNLAELSASARALIPGGDALALGALSEADALHLLGAAIPAERLSLLAHEEGLALCRDLAGHPLALLAVAPSLAERSAQEALAALRELWPSLARGEGGLRNQALAAALAYTAAALPEPMRERLDALALCASGFMETLGRRIVELDEPAWELVRTRLTAAHLWYAVALPGLNVPLVRVHAALHELWVHRLTATQRQAAGERMVSIYGAFMGWLPSVAQRSPEIMLTLARCEFPNLLRTLELLVAAERVDNASALAGQLLGLLAHLGWRATQQQASALVERAARAIVPAEGPLGRAGVRFALYQAEQLHAVGRLGEAGALMTQFSQRINQEGGLSYGGDEAAYDRGRAVRFWARLLGASGRSDMALPALTLAQQLLVGIAKPDEAAQRELAAVYQDEAELMMSAMQPGPAGVLLERALALAQALGDGALQGSLLFKLGTATAGAGDAQTARTHLQSAVRLLEVAGQMPLLMAAWEQLGTLAWRAERDLPEAERCYQQALVWAERAELPPNQAQLDLRLAELMEDGGRLADVEDYFAQAIQLYDEHDQRPGLMMANLALAEFHLRHGNPAAATTFAEAARVLGEENPGAPVWQAYRLLQHISEATGHADYAARWRARAQEAFAVAPESSAVRERWAGLIAAVQPCLRGQAVSQEVVEQLETLESEEGWRQLVAAIWRAIEGARGPELYTQLDEVDAVILLAMLEEPELHDV